MPLISQRRSAAAFSVPDAGSDAGRGPQRQEGSQRDNRRLPEQELQATTVEGPIQTRLDQAHLLHQEFPHALHGVMLVKTHLQTHAKAHVVLFSSDLERPDAQLKAYDGLRFQIECNGRDATQSWGLEDFRNVIEAAVTNAAPLSLCMVKVSSRFRREFRQRDPAWSLLDLNARFRADTYVTETIQMLPATLSRLSWRRCSTRWLA